MPLYSWSFASRPPFQVLPKVLIFLHPHYMSEPFQSCSVHLHHWSLNSSLVWTFLVLSLLVIPLNNLSTLWSCNLTANISTTRRFDIKKFLPYSAMWYLKLTNSTFKPPATWWWGAEWSGQGLQTCILLHSITNNKVDLSLKNKSHTGTLVINHSGWPWIFMDLVTVHSWDLVTLDRVQSYISWLLHL